MKKLNLVLSVLILLLALVCTVFSYFLFAKRTSLVEGWGKMAEGINSASAVMDKTSGTSNARNTLSKENLAHEKYSTSDMTSKMGTLVSQSKKVVAQRDEFSADLQDIGQAIGMKEVPEHKQLLDECGSSDDEPKGSKAVAAGVKRVVRERDNERAAANNLRKSMAEVGSIVGARSGNATEVIAAATRRREELNSAKKELSSMRSKVRQAQRDKERAQEERDDFKRQMRTAQDNARKLEFQLRKIEQDYESLTKEPYGKTPIWKDGSLEALAHVSGKVITVNPDYGYVVIDLNTNTRVTQKVGEKEHQVDPKIAPGLELVICRGDIEGEKKPKFIAKIKVRSIDDKCAVADLPNTENTIEVGDVVISNALYNRNIEAK
jgi:hypothetical protein